MVLHCHPRIRRQSKRAAAPIGTRFAVAIKLHFQTGVNGDPTDANASYVLRIHPRDPANQTYVWLN
jgi:hypothetical protein